MPKVSVILAVYNVEPYLERSLDCLINQTLKDIEIICIDDCSTDKSLEILRDYAKKDDRIIVIESEKNQGAAVARNKGLKIAKGEYLGFIDPDDTIDLNYYEELYKTAKEKNVDIAKCRIKTIHPNGKEEIGELNDEIKRENSPYMFIFEWTTAIYRKAFIQENNILFPEECPKSQDVVFLARVIFKHATLALTDGVYYNYFRREGSLDASDIPLKSIKSALLSSELVLKEINNSDVYETNPELYIKLYIRRIHAIFGILYKNKTFEAKYLCAQELINSFYKCKDIEELKKSFPYTWMIKYIENRNTEKLAKLLLKFKSPADIKEILPWYQKLFSVKNHGDGRHKIIHLFGIKMQIKKRGK